MLQLHVLDDSFVCLFCVLKTIFQLLLVLLKLLDLLSESIPLLLEVVQDLLFEHFVLPLLLELLSILVVVKLRLIEREDHILDLLLLDGELALRFPQFLLGFLKLLLQPLNVLIIHLLVKAQLVYLVAQTLVLLLQTMDLLLFLLHLEVKLVLEKRVFFNEVFFVACFSIVLVLAGAIHFLDLVLELLEHYVRSFALSLRFLGALDLYSCDVVSQAGNGLLLGGNKGTIEKLFYAALDVGLSDLALGHLHEAVGVVRQSHRQLTL